MNAIQWAICQYACRHLMEPEERVLARKLVSRADAGDEAAREAFLELTNRVLHAALNRPAPCQQ